ncbi:MAG: hypothetical protein GF418_08065 [Chitinivibrionales bacterium]|nr:hypothetical protein [Chitinivibrionales bacterium]
MGNVLLEKAEYKVEETRPGKWRRYVYPSGTRFAEYTSHAQLFDLPMVHYTHGICPETGRHVWSMKAASPEAVTYFKLLWSKLSGLLM